MLGLGPSSSYWPPCSDSGFQSVCSTIVDGQPAAFRSYLAGTAADVPAGEAVLLLLLLLLPQAAAVSASAVPIAAVAAIRAGLPPGFVNSLSHVIRAAGGR